MAKRICSYRTWRDEFFHIGNWNFSESVDGETKAYFLIDFLDLDANSGLVPSYFVRILLNKEGFFCVDNYGTHAKEIVDFFFYLKIQIYFNVGNVNFPKMSTCFNNLKTTLNECCNVFHSWETRIFSKKNWIFDDVELSNHFINSTSSKNSLKKRGLSSYFRVNEFIKVFLLTDERCLIVFDNKKIRELKILQDLVCLFDFLGVQYFIENSEWSVGGRDCNPYLKQFPYTNPDFIKSNVFFGDTI